MKKDTWFNVTMGAYLGAEVCEVVGIFSLDKISVKCDKNSIGLYHDNGLSVFNNSTWKNKIELTKNIQGLWFRKAAESNLRIVNYLDVTLNLNDDSFRPSDKPDDIFSTLTKNLTTFLIILLSIFQHLLKNSFQAILLMKNISRISYLLWRYSK